ncbi:MAG: ABC transporter ATP-binding protein [Oscillospiraceae bacterium]|nr:ABC transporter ATP-binding protein [Oscillospiraceae bacterium]
MLELKNIEKSFDNVNVLNHVNFSVEDGEIVSILGSSGSGKTTLLNIILGITQPDSGEIFFDTHDITKVSMENRGFNIVFQDYALFPNLNAYENIVYGLRNKPNISTPEEVQELVELLGLKEHLNKNIEQLSGGQKQRVALARTLVMKPKILLLDEPLSALDGVIKESIKDKIKQIAKEYHLTTIIVTHDPEEALSLSDKVMIINGGTILQYAKPDEIINSPSDSFVTEFILRQLEIKRNNILALFGGSKTVAAV